MAEKITLDPIHAGSDVRYKLTFVDEDGAVIDVGGDKLYMTVKKDLAEEDSDAAMQVSVTIPADADAALGIAYLDLTNTDTDISPRSYLYGVQWIRTASGAGKVEPVQYGPVTFLRRTTQAKT